MANYSLGIHMANKVRETIQEVFLPLTFLTRVKELESELLGAEVELEGVSLL